MILLKFMGFCHLAPDCVRCTLYRIVPQVASRWYCCDDAWIHEVDEDDVASCQAYMLFYLNK